MVFLYGNAVRVRNRLDSTGQIWAAGESKRDIHGESKRSQPTGFKQQMSDAIPVARVNAAAEQDAETDAESVRAEANAMSMVGKIPPGASAKHVARLHELCQQHNWTAEETWTQEGPPGAPCENAKKTSVA